MNYHYQKKIFFFFFIIIVIIIFFFIIFIIIIIVISYYYYYYHRVYFCAYVFINKFVFFSAPALSASNPKFCSYVHAAPILLNKCVLQIIFLFTLLFLQLRLTREFS